MEEEVKYLVAFATLPELGSQRAKLLIDYFGSAEKAWKASSGELIRTGLLDKLVKLLINKRSILNVDKYVDNLQKRNIKVFNFHEKNYPDPPLFLFLLGRMPKINKAISVVGTRQITSYGSLVTSKLVTGLVEKGYVIVSGMAVGVDTVAHETTVKNNGATIAVLGAGVDICYPKSNQWLYESILKNKGAIISEWGPGVIVPREIFPTRNRIIAGLSKAVLITEAGIHSGSMITARYALDQGKQVFVVPGPIDSPVSEGTNYLVKQGAIPVTDIDDILSQL